MKTHRVSLGFGSLVLLSAINLLADGVINLNNAGAPPERRIYAGEWVWNGSEPQFVSWEPCAGTDYHIALYWGPAGETDERNLTQVGSAPAFQTGAFAGTFSGGTRTIFSTAAGPVLSFQARAWSGTAQTYEEAVARGDSNLRAGKGPIFELKTKDPANMFEPTPNIGQAPGWRGFIIGYDGVTAIIPEPSTIALAALGAASLFLLRSSRRKS